jgi:hypothetical protein
MCLKFEKEDYYLNDQGSMVLTEIYHIKKGSCCGCKCTHCPYWPQYKKSNKNLIYNVKTRPAGL